VIELSQTFVMIKKEAIETQRELWQEVDPASIVNKLDQIIDFLAFIEKIGESKWRNMRTYNVVNS